MHRQIAGSLTGRTTKWIVLIAWLAIAAGSSMFASKLVDVQNNEASSWLPSSAESTRALDRMSAFQDVNAIPTLVVYHRDGGLTETDLTAIEEQATEFAALDGLDEPAEGRPPAVISPAAAEQIGFPAVSQDGDVAQTQVTFDFGKNGWNALPDAADDLRGIADIDGVDVYIAGLGGQAADAAEAFGGIDTTLLFATLGVVILILLFTYRSPVLWILPIMCAGIALFTSQALIYFLAKYADLTVNGQSQAILTILVIGAGTDYALLLV
ncbi:MAG: MMPL family transporter, partial [Nocardioides sp.]|uniref:MMPL family transporter n=1 Tax=Nocardioides sp. TaxID=35761 RepID=UPI003263876C